MNPARTQPVETAAQVPGSTQQSLVRALLRNKAGLTIEALAQALGISRNAVRQHISALERDGLIARGRTRSSGGRPEQLYVLTNEGQERFPRRYSWFSEMLLQLIQAEDGTAGLQEKLAQLGRSTARAMRPRLVGESGSAERIDAIATIMQELGYDAVARAEKGQLLIEAHNCVFHELAEKCPEVCSFDIALLSATGECQVEHRSCMVRGGDACRFHFGNKIPAPSAKAV